MNAIRMVVEKFKGGRNYWEVTGKTRNERQMMLKMRVFLSFNLFKHAFNSQTNRIFGQGTKPVTGQKSLVTNFVIPDKPQLPFK